MNYSRRDFGKLALGGIPLATVALSGKSLFAADKPNSIFDGVQIGTITYSYRSMPDQSAEAILKYVVDSGINAIELLDAPVDAYAQKRTGFTPPAGGGRGAGGGGTGAGASGAGAAVLRFLERSAVSGRPCSGWRWWWCAVRRLPTKWQLPPRCANGSKDCPWTSSRT